MTNWWEMVETATDLIFFSKITIDGDCSHEIKRLLLLGGKAMTNPDSILKSRYYFADKGLSSQSYGFSSSHIQMWECHKEGWVPKNWCFGTVVLEKTLENPLNCKEMQPVNPKKISPEYSLEGLMLKLQYFGYLMQRTDSWKRPWCWKRLKAGEGDGREGDGWMASPTQWTWVWVDSGSWRWTGRPGMLQFMESQSRTWLSDWTELNWYTHMYIFLLFLTTIFRSKCYWDFPSGPVVKNLLANAGARVGPLAWEDLMLWDNSACVPQLLSLHSRSCELQPMKPPQWEPQAVQEKWTPLATTIESPSAVKSK